MNAGSWQILRARREEQAPPAWFIEAADARSVKRIRARTPRPEPRSSCPRRRLDRAGEAALPTRAGADVNVCSMRRPLSVIQHITVPPYPQAALPHRYGAV